MVAVTAALMTADDYLASADTRPRWSELIDGEVSVMNNPGVRHQQIVAWLMYRLMAWCQSDRGSGISPASLDCVLDDGTVLAPDALWISDARCANLTATHLAGPPDLAIEVRSPSTWVKDTGPKWKAYERAGLPELWLIDTESDSVLVYRRSGPESPTFDLAAELASGTILSTHLLDGLHIDVAELFAR